MRIRRALLAASLLAGATAAALPTRADAVNLVITSVALQYVLPVTPLLTGMGLDYTNIDVAPHNVVSDDGLFSSGPLIPAGQTANVAGVEDLPPGSYGFFCTLHTNMRGSLEVLPIADPTSEAPGVPETPPVAPPGVVGGVATPTAITIHDGSMYAASFGANTVYELPILEAGLLGPAVPYATGFGAPAGIVFGDDGTLFVADSHPSTRGRTTDGRVWAIPAGGGVAGEVGEIVVDGLPNGRHNTNNLAIHNGQLFINNGNSTDDGVTGGDPEEQLSGTLLSVAPSARGLLVTGPEVVPAGLTIEATGMRNNYDAAFRPGTDEAWIPMNGPDTFDPFGEDLMLVADVAGPAPSFGFPSCLYAPAGTAGGTPAGAFSVKQNPTPGTGTCDPGGAHKLPEQLMGLHTSANGLAFNDAGDTVYVALFGNFFGSEVVGHKVVKLAIDANGNAGPMQDVVSLSAAPLDVTYSPNGLYVADFASGLISLVPNT